MLSSDDNGLSFLHRSINAMWVNDSSWQILCSSLLYIVELFRVEEVDINREVDAGGVCEGRNIRDKSRCTV